MEFQLNNNACASPKFKLSLMLVWKLWVCLFDCDSLDHSDLVSSLIRFGVYRMVTKTAVQCSTNRTLYHCLGNCLISFKSRQLTKSVWFSESHVTEVAHASQKPSSGVIVVCLGVRGNLLKKLEEKSPQVHFRCKYITLEAREEAAILFCSKVEFLISCCPSHNSIHSTGTSLTWNKVMQKLLLKVVYSLPTWCKHTSMSGSLHRIIRFMRFGSSPTAAVEDSKV